MPGASFSAFLVSRVWTSDLPPPIRCVQPTCKLWDMEDPLAAVVVAVGWSVQGSQAAVLSVSSIQCWLCWQYKLKYLVLVTIIMALVSQADYFCWIIWNIPPICIAYEPPSTPPFEILRSMQHHYNNSPFSYLKKKWISFAYD